MTRCDQARGLFGAIWDDEVTQAEREWFDAHLAGCEGCRAGYDGFARTLEVVGTLPRVETSTDLPERALAAARRAAAVPDRVVIVTTRPAWVPVAAAAAAVVVVGALLLPLVTPRREGAPSLVAVSEPAPPQARLVESGTSAPESSDAPTVSSVSGSLLDHSEDVEFILDPVVLHRGRAQAVTGLPDGFQGEQTVISF